MSKETEQRDAYVDAVLDAVDAKQDFANGYLDRVVGALADDTLSILAIAARPRATEAMVERALSKKNIERKQLIATLVMVEEADDLIGELVDARVEALEVNLRNGRDKTEPMGPITKKHLEARRAERNAERADAKKKVIIADPDAPSLRRGGRLPSRTKMATMSNAELRFTIRRFGLQIPRGEMLPATIRRVSRRLIGASRPDDALVAQVHKTAQRAVRQHLQVQVKDTMRRFEQAKYKAAGYRKFRWVCVLDSASCESCESRATMGSLAMKEWERIGEPGSHNLLCNGQCRCELQPSAFFRSSSKKQIEAAVV